jgi:hypothetical protein
MWIRVTGCAKNRRQPVFGNTEEVVRAKGGFNCVDGNRYAAVGRVFETDRC